jgi:hypothetical protein
MVYIPVLVIYKDCLQTAGLDIVEQKSRRNFLPFQDVGCQP